MKGIDIGQTSVAAAVAGEIVDFRELLTQPGTYRSDRGCPLFPRANITFNSSLFIMSRFKKKKTERLVAGTCNKAKHRLSPLLLCT